MVLEQQPLEGLHALGMLRLHLLIAQGLQAQVRDGEGHVEAQHVHQLRKQPPCTADGAGSGVGDRGSGIGGLRGCDAVVCSLQVQVGGDRLYNAVTHRGRLTSLITGKRQHVRQLRKQPACTAIGSEVGCEPDI